MTCKNKIGSNNMFMISNCFKFNVKITIWKNDKFLLKAVIKT